ncbi:MAG: PH domain-containing protein [Dehalococcoidia bacterium]|nr:PH domain-containing protein [Dehalococcoidia bacterium]
MDGQKKNWFSEEVSTADLVHLQDVALDRQGLLATMLKFGDLRVQTAGELEQFILRKIPHPQEVLAVLDRTRDAARRTHHLRSSRPGDLPSRCHRATMTMRRASRGL